MSTVQPNTNNTATQATAPNYAETRPRPSWLRKIHAKTLAFGAGLLACVVGFTGCPQKPEGKAKALEPIRIADLDLELMPIPAGSFMMGSDKKNDGEIGPNVTTTNKKNDEKPAHNVTITKPFWLGKYEVTQEQYEKLMGTNPSNFKGTKHPVEQVGWDNAMAYCKKLNERERTAGRLPEGYEYSLPTEAQWEYAARAGTTGDYFFNGEADELWKYGNYCDKSNTEGLFWQDTKHDDGHDNTSPVGSYKPNAWGLYDMYGNVAEMCLDWYGEDYYASSPVEDPKGPASGNGRVIRGGAWFSVARDCRSANRKGYVPSYNFNGIGFRLALVPIRTERK